MLHYITIAEPGLAMDIALAHLHSAQVEECSSMFVSLSVPDLLALYGPARSFLPEVLPAVA